MGALKKILSNIQVYQTMVLSIVLFVGVTIYHLDISPLEIFTTFSIVISLDFILVNFFGERKKGDALIFPFGGVNAGFGISFFLRSLDLITYIFAAVMAIIGKHFFRVDGKHFFNPSNFAVVLTICLFPQYTWVNTLQWGNYIDPFSFKYIAAIVMIFSFGSFVFYHVYKKLHMNYFWQLTLPFLLTHFLLFFVIPDSENMTSFFRFFSASFFIFTFFMMTDPRTIPEKPLSRVFYSISLVLTFYALQFHINEIYALLISLFINTIFLPVIRKIEYNPKNIVLFYSFLYSILCVCIAVGIYLYGRPDLAFDNVCNQLICK